MQISLLAAKPMSLTFTPAELRLLRYAAEGAKLETLALQEGISKKEIEMRLKNVFKRLDSRDPVEALQKLAQSNFKVVDR
jgi:DNA-binding CsgD family transcriptional regulator